MNYPMINRDGAVALFHELMKADGLYRFMHLHGEGKMGKSHLITKVFPEIAKNSYNTHCVVLDFRDNADGIIELLNNACGLLGDRSYSLHFDRAYQQWLNRSRIEAQNIQTFFSKISMRSREEAGETQRHILELTRSFVEDLRVMQPTPLLLICDTVDNAAEETQRWLMNTLLVQLAHLNHVRVVVGGRTLPTASGSYASRCCEHPLRPVYEEEAYIDYCHKKGIKLGQDQISLLIQAANYRPGFFAELIQNVTLGSAFNVR